MKKIFSKKYIQVVTVIILSFIIAFFAELMFNGEDFPLLPRY